ncbi:MAG: hypothetical protein AB1758_25275, partial [Candidatus Eremiobacterota bacterium]
EKEEAAPLDPLQAASLFDSVPTVGEMSAFLRRLTERRSVATVLANLARALPSPRGLELVQKGFELSPAQLERLGQLAPNLQPATLGAFCVLVDLESGRDPLGLSAEALATLAEFFGFGTGNGSADRAMLERLQGLRTRRSAVDALEDLARESGSRRVDAFVQAVRPEMPLGHFRVNDELLSLGKLLEAAGRAVNPHTLMALAMFCDVEVGNVTRADVSQLARSAESFDSSMYAMMTAAGAFGMTLSAFALDQVEDDLGALAAWSEGGLLACYRKPQVRGRWWEHLRGPDEVRQIRELGLDFEGVILAHPPLLEGLTNADLDCLLAAGSLVAGFLHGEEHRLLRVEGAVDYSAFDGRVLAALEAPTGDPEELQLSGQRVVLPNLAGFPATLRELDMGGLLGWREALSARLVRLRQLARAARRALRSPSRVSVRRNPDRLTPWLTYLESHRADSLLEGLVARTTREGVLRELLRDTSVDFYLHEELARLGQTAPETAALVLLYFLLVSDAVRLGGGLKQFDPGRLRTLVFSRLTEGMPQAPVALARLMATAELNSDSNARLMAEYELSQLAATSDLDAASAALEGLIRLSLVEQNPLPQLVDVGPPGQESFDRTLDPAEVERSLEEIGRWLEEERSRDELAPLGLPFTDSEGRLVTDKARPLAERMAAVAQASREDDSLRRRRYYCLVPSQRLTLMGKALIESWRHLARTMGRSPERLAQDPNPAAILQEHRLLMEDPDASMRASWGGCPYLGGDERNTIYHLTPEEGWGVWTFQPKPPGPPERRESRFFRDLVELSRRVELDQVEVLRIDERVEGLTTFDPWISTSKRVDLRWVEVLDVAQARFVPLTAFLSDLLAYGYRDEGPALRALLELTRGGPGSVAFTAAAQAVSADAPRYRVQELDEEARERAARRLVTTLELPQEDAPGVARMLRRTP